MACSLAPVLRPAAPSPRRVAVVPLEGLSPGRIGELRHGIRPFAGTVIDDRRLPHALVLTPGHCAAMYGGLRPWARIVREYLRGRRIPASIAVGFDPLLAHAVASTRVGVCVLGTPREERARALAVPLRELGLPPLERERLVRGGAHTLGELLELPVELAGRVGGPCAASLHQRFAGPRQLALGVAVAPEALDVTVAPEPLREAG